VSTPAAALLRETIAPHALGLTINGVELETTTNDPEVSEGLRRYYAPWVTSVSLPVVRVRLIQGQVSPRGPFQDLVRFDGKRVKEAVQEVGAGRLILKRATGVVMGLWPGHALAVGDLRANLNQAINLVNACYAKIVLDRGYALLHASAVSRKGQAVVLAGTPGAGKSSAALHLVEAGFHFVSNDRVLARPHADRVEVWGYPKQPRVNPGTLVGHSRLSTLLGPDERAALASMDREKLWNLESKRDVDLDAIYGPGTVELCAEARALVLLRWRRTGSGFSIEPLDVDAALERLAIFRKDLGAFDLDRPPATPPTPAELAGYRALLEAVPVFEVTGRVDFRTLVGAVTSLLAAA
jgi:HprK-related kinase B